MSKPNRRSLSAAAALALVVLAGGAALAACNPPSQSGLTVPSNLASQLPALEIPTSSVITTTGACIDPATAAILNKLVAQGANVPSLLANNKDALISGLQSFQPPDQATGTWRDQLVAALQANDLTKAAAQIQMLASGQVTVSSC